MKCLISGNIFFNVKVTKMQYKYKSVIKNIEKTYKIT